MLDGSFATKSETADPPATGLRAGIEEQAAAAALITSAYDTALKSSPEAADSGLLSFQNAASAEILSRNYELLKGLGTDPAPTLWQSLLPVRWGENNPTWQTFQGRNSLSYQQFDGITPQDISRFNEMTDPRLRDRYETNLAADKEHAKNYYQVVTGGLGTLTGCVVGSFARRNAYVLGAVALGTAIGVVSGRVGGEALVQGFHDARQGRVDEIVRNLRLG